MLKHDAVWRPTKGEGEGAKRGMQKGCLMRFRAVSCVARALSFVRFRAVSCGLVRSRAVSRGLARPRAVSCGLVRFGAGAK
eukprot:4040084-Alexandrium_andersonii.AAC.1